MSATRIYGVDFTSAPGRAKPITVAVATLHDAELIVERVDELRSFEAFEALLATPGPWVGGFDFPFGWPREVVEALGWQPAWAAYVAAAASLTTAELGERLAAFRRPRLAGTKQPSRPADAAARSRSPIMWYGVPVGRMFRQGAPRLLDAGLDIVPCHRTGDTRVALETYPALAARRVVGRASYKGRPDAARRQAREAIVAALEADLGEAYAVRLALGEGVARAAIDDAGGDTLDAVLCAVQAAWASREPGYGVPEGADTAEGWIVEPGLG